MAYPISEKIIMPIQPYDTADYHVFGTKLPFKKILRVIHLGDDIAGEPGKPVYAGTTGEVIYSHIHSGSPKNKTWGGLVVIGHTNKKNETPFYSVYGHIYKIAVAVGQGVSTGQIIGYIAPALTAENGWWQHPHLHFGIYTGPWHGHILPGYKRPTEFFRTRMSWWHNPREFINRYNG